MKPLWDYVVLKEVKPEQAENGLVAPNYNNIEHNDEAEVIAVGPECKGDMAVGNKVIFKRYGFEIVIVDKEEMLIGKQENIIAQL